MRRPSEPRGRCDRARLIAGLAICLVAACTSPAAAQSTAPAASEISISGSLRTRLEAWNWFGDNADGDYAYPGLLFRLAVGQTRRRLDWQVELAVPFILALPDRAVVPGAQGALGMGGNYYAANDNRTNPANAFLKQGYIRIKDMGGVAGQSLTFGRTEVVDGTEVAPKDASLAALKRDRIAHRLLGNFIFTHVGRSFDGAQYALNQPNRNITVIAARPTDGVFQVNGWKELDITIVYGALTRQTGGSNNTGEWRAFGLWYDDYRDGVVKTDNRSLAVRRADTDSINVGTIGGHYLRLVKAGSGSVDLLAWGAGQFGSWGALGHKAGAFAVEAGWQPAVSAWKPWIRGGFSYATGDGDTADDTHSTFFQILPTPRVYARFPFFNLMNTRDGFGEVILRPSTKLTVRADAHALWLTDANDLWYQGGGAFEPDTFGYAGRPSGGRTKLGALYDGSGDYVFNRHLTVSGYYGYAAGASVPQAIYVDGAGQFGYAEVMVRF
jgi:hypothetical protein